MVNKYNAVKTEIGGLKFDSKYEANCYLYLKKLYPNNEIKVHQNVVFYENSKGRLVINVDFVITFPGFEHYYEAKGNLTDLFKYKLGLIKMFNPDLYKELTVITENVAAFKYLQKKGVRTIKQSFNEDNYGN